MNHFQLVVHLVSIREPCTMGRQRFLGWYLNYALAIGVSSHRLVAGRIQQTRLTRSYALIVNVIVFLTLPVVIWHAANYFRYSTWIPMHFPITIYLYFAVSFASIALMILTRGSRDSQSIDLHRIIFRVKRKNTLNADRVLIYLFYWKLGALIFLCFANISIVFFLPAGAPWMHYLISFCLNNTLNIPAVAMYRYFMSLWFICDCYQYINCRVDDISNCVSSREPLRSELRELHRLWHLHAALRRHIMRINKVYSLPMLMARFEFITLSVINGYWGVLYSLATRTPFSMLVIGTINYWVHMLDFFLLDTMCDITVQYQNAPHHAVSQGIWYKEVLL